MTAPSEIRVAAIGAGHVFPWYRRAIERRPDATLAAVVEPRPDTDTGPAPRFTTLDELLDSGLEVDAALVLTPADTHVGLARAALAAGLHTLVEKPVALDLAQIDDLRAAAETAAVACWPAHTYAYEPGAVEARALLDDGALGQVGYARFSYLKQHDEPFSLRYPPILHQHGIHLLYLLLHLLGRPDEVSARLAQVVYRTPGHHDQAALTLAYADGLLVQVALAIGLDGRSTPPGVVSYELYGSGGSFTRSWRDALVSHGTELVAAAYPLSFERLLEAFLAACRGDARHPLSSLAEARDAECVRAAAIQSHLERTSVRIDYS